MTSATSEFKGQTANAMATHVNGTLLISKVVFVVILFVLSFLFSVLPLKFKNYASKANRVVVHYGSCVSSGVFLGTCLLVLLPNVERMLRNAFTTSYPLKYLFIAFGFLLALFIEHLTTSCVEEVIYRHQYYDPAAKNFNVRKKRIIRNPDSPVDDSEESDIENYCNTNQKSRPKNHRTIGIILNIVLSFHGIFEGFTIGLFNDHAHIVELYVAIMIHKLLVSLGLGFKLVSESFELREILICSLIFSAMSPIGAAVAMAISTNQNLQNNIVGGISIAIASGTFLYLTFVDMIPKDLNEIENGRRMLNVFSLVIGFAFIGCVTLFLI